MKDNLPVMYLVFRRDLELSPGKMAAQAGHAVARLVRTLTDNQWDIYTSLGNERKISVSTKNENAMLALAACAEVENIPFASVHDAGHTEVEPNTLTCIAIGPVERGKYNFLNRLQLF